jgi:glycosyltransferase involved in cell wall biosynthesis
MTQRHPVAAERDHPPPILSTVLLNWNRADLLRRTLDSYLATVSVPYELIVIDNASTDDSAAVIGTACDIVSHHRAIMLPENRGGEAINLGIEQARGHYVHVSENDVEYRPGWDRDLIAKLRAFPSLGQLSPFTPSSNPSTPWTEGDLTVRVAETNITTTCLCPREVYERGVRWKTVGWGTVRFPADGDFSWTLKNMGYVVAWNDVDAAINLGFQLEEFVGRVPYYLENYAAKPDVGVAGYERILNQAGYRLVQDENGRWVARGG